MSETFMISQ